MTTLYESVESVLSNACRAVNSAVVESYWQIGQTIVDEEQQGNHRTEYGAGLLKYLPEKLSTDFGEGFDECNLRYMRLFYNAFPIRHAVCDELIWTHYWLLSKVTTEKSRLWYMDEAASQNWSSRALDRQISTLYYDRLLATREANRPALEAEARQKTAPKTFLLKQASQPL